MLNCEFELLLMSLLKINPVLEEEYIAIFPQEKFDKGPTLILI